MEYQNQQQSNLFTQGQRSLPNATTVLVLGILSIVLCFICGIIAMVISSGDKKLYEQNPGIYSTSSYDLVKAGRICAIISFCIWGLMILFYIFIVIVAVGAGSMLDN
jgi:hypothetical protein